MGGFMGRIHAYITGIHAYTYIQYCNFFDSNLKPSKTWLVGWDMIYVSQGFDHTLGTYLSLPLTHTSYPELSNTDHGDTRTRPEVSEPKCYSPVPATSRPLPKNKQLFDSFHLSACMLLPSGSKFGFPGSERTKQGVLYDVELPSNHDHWPKSRPSLFFLSFLLG